MSIKLIGYTIIASLYLPINAFAIDTVIINANIINPTKNPTPKLGYIIIHQDKIKKVGYGKPILSPNMKIYDAKNQYAIPGLIDSHTHIDTVLGIK